ncbi:RodZ domain-containing protein [Thioflexithrix psekupsensis]|uniref:Cytoskeleton protein RodZ-like C-terminal domain-containing protein n=1 Tax=Thioflexithrix psekupsensis TaxID=1570016 RepID=A0A251X5G5_9GAMM|nr:RodZ domain-containing protein [Thioflexithrix psekupsensis]OUD12177.1 hypothetical protein TPSD3_13715 [Thioflexithrix psekupsensis]
MTHSSSPYTLYHSDRYRRDPATPLSPMESDGSVLASLSDDTPVESPKDDMPETPANPMSLEKNDTQYHIVAMTGETVDHPVDNAASPPVSDSDVLTHSETVVTTVPMVSATPAVPKTPGAYLKQHREQKRLSIEHIADKLCLHQGVILALEADNYEVLPPPVFVRGYFRAYADLLDTSVEPILALYAQQNQDLTPPPLTLHHNKPTSQASSADPWFKVGTLILFLSIMVLMTLWKFYPDFQPTQPEAVTPVPSSSAPLDRRLPGEDLGIAQPLTGMQPIPLSTNANPESSVLVYTPPGEEEGNDAPEQATAVSETATPAATTTPAQAEPPVQTPPSNSLTVKVTREAWMQINDKDGKQLFLGTAAAGRTLTLEGTPPYQIRVGNLDGVSVDYQGTSQPLSAYPRGEGGRRVYVVGQASQQASP